MPVDTLSRIDLNLLVAMQVLLEERNVTRAAERMFVTQPAMSKTLLRLRTAFDDPLFTRSGRGLVPTPRALEIQRQLPEILNSVSQVLEEQDFDPTTREASIHIVAPEFLAVQAIPELTKRLQEESPGISLALSNIDDNCEQLLESGEIDFAMEIEKNLPKDFITTPLGDLRPAVWMRKGHPLSDHDPSLDEMLEYPFIQYFLLIADKVSPNTESRFDRMLHELGRKRQKALTTDQLMTALDTLNTSDCLMMATMDDLKQEGEYYEIVRKPYPKEVEHYPEIPAVLIQHRRTLNSPTHEWVKEKILSIVRGIRVERGIREFSEDN
jgi:DNA-binding transcriptional LysR family regulator